MARTPVAMESLEARKLMAVTFNFSINDLGGTFRPYYDRIRTVVQQAGRDWAALFDPAQSNASVEIEVQFKSSKTNFGLDGVIAFASPITFQKTGVRPDDSSTDIVDPGPLYEIKTDIDPNGQEPDAIITFVAESLEDGFFDTSAQRVVPSGKLDVLSVATHEIGHTIGFITQNNFSQDPVFNPDTLRNEQTSLAALLIFGELQGPEGPPTEMGLGFTGAAAKSVYGSNVPFTLDTGAHYGSNFSLDPGDPGYDLRFNLMNPFGTEGRKFTVSSIDAAILADLGAPVLGTFDVIPTATPVLTIDGTTADDTIEVIATGNQLIVKRNFVVTTQTFAIGDFTSVVINAGAGQDRILISGAVPAVSVNAGDGNDTITGGAGDDTVNGGAGVDRIFGNSGNDLLLGGGGVDQIYGGDGADTLFGGRQNDFLDGGAGGDFIDGGADNDFVNGSSGSDDLFGSSGMDTLSGGASRDTLNGGFGADILQGNGGNDVVDYSDRAASLFLSADDLANDGEAGEGDNIDGGIEAFMGGAGADKMLGGGLNNTLIGGEGNDTLVGGAGDDRLEGGSGSDALDGGAGNDSLVGGGGNDRMVGGTGGDRFFGQAGNDLFYSKDVFRDSLEGGDGNDRFDGDSIDELLDVEDTI